MPLPAQFQLGLELTNIVNPISQAMSALGSLAVIDAIKRSGSDFITETKLASLIGRHRVDPVIKFHFQQMVAKSDQSVISRYLDIILESGSGPTVQEALKNPALFSMVIQLSALAFAHEDESLANAIVEAIERIVKEADGDVGIVPDYASLLGTIRACQQQTSAFRWALLFEDVEEKVRKALAGFEDFRHETQKLNASFKNPDKFRRLRIPVLQGLLMWLQSLQSFPEHRLLHLRCDYGISTVVVWCHHILGLSLIIKIERTEIRFGDAPYNLVVENSLSQNAGVSLMDPLDPQEPLFTLQNDQHSVGISYEHRAEAYGYGAKVLQLKGIPEDQRKDYAQWVICHSYRFCDGADSKSFPRALLHNSPRTRLQTAGRFLFAIDEKVTLSISKPAKFQDVFKLDEDPDVLALVNIIIAFARICEDDLANCREIPLTLNVTTMLSDKVFARPDLSKSFEILCLLLLGRHLYHDDYVKSAILLSAWGWSIYYDSTDAVDPCDGSTDTLRLLRGVPSRRGFRANRIIDGPQRAVPPKDYHRREDVSLIPGVATAERGVILVGHHSDAFQVTQQFTFKVNYSTLTCGYGLREMMHSALMSRRLPTCQCDKPRREISSSSPSHVTPSARTISAIDSIIKEEDSLFKRHELRQHSDLERAFASKDGNRHFIYVSDNPAARWVQLLNLLSNLREDGVSLSTQMRETYHYAVLRGPNTCIECAVSNSKHWPNGIFLL